MKKFKKNTVGMVVCFLLLVVASPSICLGSKGVKAAQDFVDVGRTDRAIEVLRNWINQEAKDFDAYWLLANLYMQQGAYGQAEEQFGYALNLKPGKQKEVTEKFKTAFKHEVASGNVSSAKSLAQKVIGFEPAYKQQAYDAFYAKGKSSSGQQAVEAFDAAFTFAGTQADYEKIGKNYLKLALENAQFGYLVDKATKILGKEFVDQVMPSQQTVTLFSQTYTDADLGADGKVVILDFTKTKIVPGDVLMIYTTVPNNGGNVKVYFHDGKQFVIPNNGNQRCKYDSSDTLDKGSEVISFTKGSGIKIRTEVIRAVIKNANYTLLSGI